MAEFMHTELFASFSLWARHHTFILHENIQHVSPGLENSGTESLWLEFLGS
jgi:hypothetical protein